MEKVKERTSGQIGFWLPDYSDSALTAGCYGNHACLTFGGWVTALDACYLLPLPLGSQFRSCSSHCMFSSTEKCDHGALQGCSMHSFLTAVVKGVFPQTRVEKLPLPGLERLLPLVKMTHEYLGAPCSQNHHCLPTYSHPNIRIPFLPIQCLHFNGRHTVRLGFQFAL